MWVLTLLLGFVVGALTIIAVEALGVVFVIGRLNRKVRKEDEKTASVSARGFSDLRHSPDNFSAYKKQGFVWVLEPEKIPKSWLVDKTLKEQKRKKDIFEVAPVRKFAKVKDQSLILTESDGSHTNILMKGCSVVAVSATDLSSRKWAKKYPVTVESKTSVIYRGSKTVYLYFETSWEKEAWCKSLRLASCNDNEKLKWFANLNAEFLSYLTALNAGYPSFMKPSGSSEDFHVEELVDRSAKLDGSSAKVRQFFKKISRKASRNGVENRSGWISSSGREERKLGDRSHSFHASTFSTGAAKTAPIGKAPSSIREEGTVSSSPALAHSSSRRCNFVLSDVDNGDKNGSDEGPLSLNLLISRLFFDAKSNTEIAKSAQARIQRTLSNMRIPSYIGELTCTGIDLGTLPPSINGLRVIPLDMNEIWALEIDVQYSGGLVLDVETRLEVRELDFEEGVNTNLVSNSAREVTSELLEGFEHIGKQLEFSQGADATELKDEGEIEPEGVGSSKNNTKSSTPVSKWKCMLNSVAKQVSQVPLSLAIRVASLRGTLRLHIKPPPSDQLWFGFTSMPDIDFNLESSVGEHKIASTRVALFLNSRFKAALRDTLVLPNCEGVCIPWMLAEKDDWAPRRIAPFIWVNQEASADPVVRETSGSHKPPKIAHADEPSRKSTSNIPDDRGKKVDFTIQSASEPSSVHHSSSQDLSFQPATIRGSSSSQSLPELDTPSSSNEEQLATREVSKEDEVSSFSFSPSRSLSSTSDRVQLVEGEDMRPKRLGTRARMIGLRQRMGEKFEEKRRHIEEKGRTIVERMRAP